MKTTNPFLKQFLRICIFTFALLLNGYVNAADRFWVATSSSNWNNTTNWSTTSGGSGGASIPGSSDVVIYDGGGLGNATLDINVNVAGISVTSVYTGTISQGAFIINTGFSGATFSGGVFLGGTASISTITLTVSGTNFTSTSGNLSIRGNYTFSSGVFNPNNGTVIFRGSKTITGSDTFDNVEFQGVGTTDVMTFGSGTILTVVGTLTLQSGGNFIFLDGSIDVQGDIVALNNGRGSTVFNINGTGNQVFTGRVTAFVGSLPNVVIDKPSGVLTLVNTIAIRGTWTYIQGNIDATTNNATVLFHGSNTITGSVTLNNVEFRGVGTTDVMTLTSGTILTVAGTLTLHAGGNFRFLGESINVQGDLVTSNSGSGGFGSTIFNINGTGNQTFTGRTGPVISIIGLLPNVVIDKPSGLLTLVNTIAIRGNWTYIQGNLDVTNSTLLFHGSKTITGSVTLDNVEFRGVGTTDVMTLSSGTILTVAGTTTLQAGGNFRFLGESINVQGDLITANSGGSGSTIFNISGTGNQTITGRTGPVIGIIGLLPNVVIDKPSGLLTLANTVAIRGNWTYIQGNLDATTNNSTVLFHGAKTVTGSITLNNVEFRPAGQTGITIDPATTLTTVGTLTLGAGAFLRLDGGTIDALGDIFSTSLSCCNGGSATINIKGAGDQILTGSTALHDLSAGVGEFPNIIIDKPSGTLTLFNIISVRGNWTYISGDVDATTNNSTVSFYGPFVTDAEGASETMKFSNVRIGSFSTRTLQSDLIVNNVLFLDRGELRLNSNKLVLENNSPAAIVRSQARLVGDTQDNNSRVQWNIGNNTGNYSVPFFTAGGVNIALNLNVNTAGTESGTGNLTFSTYPTNPANLPFPEGVTNIKDLTETDVSLETVDRFWQVNANNYSTNPIADIIFKYSSGEIAGGNTITEADLLPFRWNGSEWVLNPVGVVNTVANTVEANNINIFSPWILAEFFTPLPGGPFSPIKNPGFITGTVYNDIDTNCVIDTLVDFPLANRMIEAQPGPFLVLTDSEGNFEFRVPADTYTIRQAKILADPLKQIICPGTDSVYSVTVAENESKINNDFFDVLIDPNPISGRTVGIYPAPLSTPCSGQINSYCTTFDNTGGLPISVDPPGSGVVTFQIVLTSIPAGVTIVPGSITDDCGCITPVTVIGNTITCLRSSTYPTNEICTICFDVDIPNGFPLGGPVTIESSISGRVSNVSTTVVFPTLNDLVDCAVDPNDKLVVTPKGCGPFGNIPRGEEMIYLIRFQNVGSIPATHVVIRDSLDNDLDVTTLRVLGTSDPLTRVEIIPGNELILTFENINLPDSLSDPEGSQGFVTFSIKPKDNLPNGTEITNTAGIIFDLNEPVITNTTLNTIRDNPFPLVSFEATRQCASTTNTFDFTYTGGTSDGASFNWDFGLNATPSVSTDENPSGILFSTTGPQEVTLTMDRFGCTASATNIIDVANVTCGNNNKVLVCHIPNGNPNNSQLICISPSALPAHLAHGDCVGPCIPSSAKMGGHMEEDDDNLGINKEDQLQNNIISSDIVFESYPNPFSDVTMITFSLPTTENVILEVSNLSGEQVAVLYNGLAESGNLYSLEFDAQLHASGIYYYRLITESNTHTKKLVVLK